LSRESPDSLGRSTTTGKALTSIPCQGWYCLQTRNSAADRDCSRVESNKQFLVMPGAFSDSTSTWCKHVQTNYVKAG
jgi:hypothetical protein